jgi:predicted kinase
LGIAAAAVITKAFMKKDDSAHLILLGGLPGSGKSKYLERLETEGWTVFDDFQKRAINNVALFRMSRHYSELVQALREGRPSVVADVRLVTAEYRDDAERTLRADLSGLAIELRLFELDQAQCAENIKNSPDPRDVPNRLRILGEFAPQHSMPQGAVRLPVWRPPV